MRIANRFGRLVIVDPEGLAVDVERASEGRFGADPQAIYAQWDAFIDWASQAELPQGETFDADELDSPVPGPRQVFAVGLNYRDHADESGFVPPTEPLIFTKFATCITGPQGVIQLPTGGHTDWEVELVAVIGRETRQVPVEEALSYVAGYSIGQDLSERIVQMAAKPPQFSLGKSFPGFGPIGPWVVTLDEFQDPNDIELGCSIDGEQMQLSRTRHLLFSVSELIHRLSTNLTLLPGDVIFTGTPAGCGVAMNPQRWLQPGEELVSRIEGIGELRHRFVAAKEE